MTAPYDDAEFIDRDFQASKAAAAAATAPLPAPGTSVKARPPTRQELEVQLNSTQQQIDELRRLQDQLERERAGIEETRRRRAEFETGRGEVLEDLTRGIGLLEKAEFEARREAEQMSRTLDGFRQSLEAVRAIREDSWTEANLASELTAALTAVENARMEWNSARLKWTLLDGGKPEGKADVDAGSPAGWQDPGFWGWCRMGLAVTLPLALVGLAGVILLAVLLGRQ
ncbi:MAG: hypothetical protein H7A47_03695 [Verrucomicrobiales bacterium]|nr:hypothetical protein [Verrucomicrobiales bacterium]